MLAIGMGSAKSEKESLPGEESTDKNGAPFTRSVYFRSLCQGAPPHQPAMRIEQKTVVASLMLAFTALSGHAGESTPGEKNPSAKNPVAAGCGHNPGPWDTSIYSGLSLTQGTVDSLTVNAGILAKGTWTSDEIILMADYLYGDTDGATTNNTFRAGAQYNHLLTDRSYLGLTSGFLYD